MLLSTMSVTFFAGILVRSYAWLSIFGNWGLLNWFLRLVGQDQPPTLAYTFGNMLLASIQLELPLFILPLYGVMRGIDQKLAKAAQSLGADPLTAWLTTFLPLALPGIAVSTALVFLTALGFYATPALLGPPDTYLLAQELEVHINTLGDENGASARIVVMVGLILIAAGLACLSYLWAARLRQGHASAGGGPIGGTVERLARLIAPFRWIPVVICVVLVVILLLLPIAMLLPLAFNGGDYLSFPPRSLSLRWFYNYLGDPDLLTSTLFSLQIATTAAAIASLAGAAAALSANKFRTVPRLFLSLICGAPLVVSSITITASLFLLALHLPWLNPGLLFVAVYSVLGLPFSFLLIGAADARLDPRLARAAASMGASPWVTMRTITLPLLAPSFVSAFVFAFLFAFDDVSAGLFLSSFDHTPLSVRLWENMKYAITPLPASIAVLGSLVGAAVYGLSRLRRRLARHHRRTTTEGGRRFARGFTSREPK
jgi:putative spermidine/putrescine transport system permease protein